MIVSYQEKLAFTNYIHSIAEDVKMKVFFDIDTDGTPYNNGKEIHLYKLTNTITRDDLMRMRAYIVHEVGHKKYTNFDIIKDKPELCIPVEEQSLFRDVWMQLEDHRVDNLTVKRGEFAGDKTTLSYLEDMISDRMVPTIRENIDKLDFNSTVNAAVYAMDVANRSSFLSGAGTSGVEVTEMLRQESKRPKVANKILKLSYKLLEIRDITDPVIGSEATYQLAKRIIKEAREQEEEDKEEQQSQEAGSEGEADNNEEVSVEVAPRSAVHSPHEEQGAPIPDSNMPAPEYDDSRIPALSPLSDYIILDYAKNKVIAGATSDIASNTTYYAYDVTDRSPSKYHNYPHNVAKLLDNSNTAQLQNEVRRILQVRSKAIRAFNQKRGKLTARDVHRVLMRDAKGYNERVFNQKRDALSLDVAVTLLVDFSGSMSGSRATNAIAACHMLSNTLAALQINHGIEGFTDAQSSPVHMIFKKHTKVRDPNLLENLCAATKYMSANSDADNVALAAYRLGQQRNKRKVLIVLSDGSPATNIKKGDHNSFLKQTIDEVGKTGIEIIGLGIETNYGKKFYPIWETLSSASQLEQGLLNILRNTIFSV